VLLVVTQSQAQHLHPLQTHQHAHCATRVPSAHHLVLLYQPALVTVVQVLTHLRVHHLVRNVPLERLVHHLVLMYQPAQEGVQWVRTLLQVPLFVQHVQPIRSDQRLV